LPFCLTTLCSSAKAFSGFGIEQKTKVANAASKEFAANGKVSAFA
jgi:hypothetical protein